jgi:hypothetical protein
MNEAAITETILYFSKRTGGPEPRKQKMRAEFINLILSCLQPGDIFVSPFRPSIFIDLSSVMASFQNLPQSLDIFKNLFFVSGNWWIFT